MKVMIDARFWGLEHAGLGRYATNLVRNLGQIDQENHYLLLLRKKYFNQDLGLPDNFKPVLADVQHHSLAEQIKLPQIIRRENPDLVHYLYFIVPIFSRYNFIVTIHDLIKHKHSGGEATTLSKPVYYAKYLAYHLDMWWAARRSKHIIVPTQYVKDEIAGYYHLPTEKVTVTYEGADQEIQSDSQNPQKILDKYHIKEPYLFYVGNVYPYKNIPRLIEALKYLPQEISLVIACSRSVFWEKLRRIVTAQNMTPRVNLAGFVPDEDLGTLYQQALAFVSPSLDEGFGITPLEAMASGTPVIVSDIACFPETCRDAALYFDPFNPKEIAEKIEQLYENKVLRQELIEKGKNNLRRFSWQEMARQTLAVYHKVIR